jgi:hypothetical protein
MKPFPGKTEERRRMRREAKSHLSSYSPPYICFPDLHHPNAFDAMHQCMSCMNVDACIQNGYEPSHLHHPNAFDIMHQCMSCMNIYIYIYICMYINGYELSDQIDFIAWFSL